MQSPSFLDSGSSAFKSMFLVDNDCILALYTILKVLLFSMFLLLSLMVWFTFPNLTFAFFFTLYGLVSAFFWNGIPVTLSRGPLIG